MIQETCLNYPPSKQLILDLTAAGMVPIEKLDLMYKTFPVTGIISNLNGANDALILSETDIKMLFFSMNMTTKS